ncbi:PP2C family protein-serine/threonine phosphatase [Rhodohalobacter halophilus]|uniref:PP2C family protein-serine/threonine phosphatase n=1 Tax=Rhodohalobacter halophilus TaxID=1812810 RepID=UPI00114CE73E|nr:PP2C family protein-serine/threonine phosphatase [Rhodohalobacter halophilus]
MSFSFDSAKTDTLLVIAGILAAFLFFWLYGQSHPLSLADPSLGEEAASQRAQSVVQSYGYQPQDIPITDFRVKSALLDSLQSGTDINQFYRIEANRLNFPAFYWRSEFLIELADANDFMAGPMQNQIVSVHLNERGEVIELVNSENRLPSTFFHADVLSFALDIEHPRIPPEAVDSLIFERIQFQLSGNEESLSLNMEHGELTRLNRATAEKMAQYYLERSGWAGSNYEIANVEKVPVGVTDAAKVSFQYEHPEFSTRGELNITVLPTGALLSMRHSLQSGGSASMSSTSILSGIRGAVLLLVLFWVLILFIIRFRMRLIDTKAAILVAVLAGFIMPLVVLSETVHEYIKNFGSFDFNLISMVLIVGGLTAAFTSLVYFLITSIADSITRQNWPEKLQSIDLIRIGHFFNKPVGSTFIRGISYSFILAGIWALMYYLIPDRFLSVEPVFYSNGRYISNIVLMLSNLAIYFFAAQLIFLIFLGKVKAVMSKPVWVVLLTGVVFAVMNPLGIDVGPMGTEFIMMGVVGLAIGWMYVRDDFLTVFLALFFFVNHLTTASGWVMEQSPDALLFYTNILIAAVGVAFGGYCMSTGKSARDLPNFVPEYVDELAQSERIKQELQIARKVQTSFLPVSTPDVEGLQISAVCRPAFETGGDYYDFISLPDQRLAVTIGDVSGKGIQAAFYMTFIKGVIHAVCENFKSTIEVLVRVNKLFRQNARKGTFISLIFGVFDSQKNVFTFSRAGHNPLLYFDSKEKKLHVFTPQGIGLGITDEELFRNNIMEQSVDVHKNDILILYTDGVVEATNNLNKYYGDNRLKKLIEAYHEADAETILSKIVDDLQTFGNGANQHDDMTIVVIKKK